MDAKEFFTAEEYSDFISDYEDKWLQFESAEQRLRAYFGTVENAKTLYEKWLNDEELFAFEKFIMLG